MTLSIRQTPDGLIFKILVQPRASKNQVVGLHGDALKIRLTAPPVAGAANKMCAAFLGKTLGVPKSSVEIVTGHTGRSKQVKIIFPQGSETTAKKRAQLRLAVLSLAEKSG